MRSRVVMLRVPRIPFSSLAGRGKGNNTFAGAGGRVIAMARRESKRAYKA